MKLIKGKRYEVTVLGYEDEIYDEERAYKCIYEGKDCGCFVFSVINSFELLYIEPKTMKVNIKEV